MCARKRRRAEREREICGNRRRKLGRFHAVRFSLSEKYRRQRLYVRRKANGLFRLFSFYIRLRRARHGDREKNLCGSCRKIKYGGKKYEKLRVYV